MPTSAQSLGADLEAALLRQLQATWHELNASYFKRRMQPPTLRLSDGDGRLGQWRADERAIALSRGFVLAHGWGVVVEVLKHEMAHQFVCEVLGQPDEVAHGAAFRAVCEAHGIDASAAGVPRAPTPKTTPKTTVDSQSPEARMLARVTKLLALAGSSNVHEAELAMAEAQRLMLRHNLSLTTRSPYSFRHLGEPTGRVGEHLRQLACILNEHFFVETIWVPVWRAREGKRGSVLEACGTVTNLEIAEHTFDFLLHTAERLWAQYKRERGLRGDGERRTYLAGVMVGFRDQLEKQRQRHAAQGLVWVGDGALNDWWRRRHPHIRWTHHAAVPRTEAHADGRKAGRKIVLHRAVQERVQRDRLLPQAR